MVEMYVENEPMPNNRPVYIRGTGSVTYTKKFNRIAQPSESLDESDEKGNSIVIHP